LHPHPDWQLFAILTHPKTLPPKSVHRYRHEYAMHGIGVVVVAAPVVLVQIAHGSGGMPVVVGPESPQYVSAIAHAVPASDGCTHVQPC